MSLPRLPETSFVKPVNPPAEPGEEVFTPPNERQGKDEPPKLSEDEMAILRAWNELQAQEKPITRTAIMQHLGWTKKRWETIKTVCDTYKIAC